MAKFCSKCGAPLREGAGFCPACGHKVSDPVPAPVSEPDNTAAPAPSPVPTEPVPQESGLVPRQEPAPAAGVKKKGKASKEARCGNCGETLRAGHGFCTRCGAPRGAVPKNRRVVIDKNGHARLKKKRNPKGIIAAILAVALLFTGVVQPGWIFGLIYRPGKALGAEQVEVEVTSNGQVVAKGAATDGVGLPVNVRYTEEERAKATAQSVEVSVENPVAHMDGGIIVDFGDNLALLADEEDENAVFDDSPKTFTLRTLPAKEDAEHGCLVSGWDFELGDVHDFALPVKVTVPYGAAKDPYSLVPQHYNEEMGRWEYTAYEVNEDERTVTFYLHHFSDSLLAEYTREMNEERDAADMSGAPLNMITVELLPSKMEQAYTARAEAAEYVNAMLARNEQSTLEWLYQASGDVGNIATGTDIHVGLKDLIVSNGNLLNGADIGLNAVGIFFAGVKVYRDFLRTESFDEAVSRNKLDLMGAAVSAAGIANTASGIATGAGLFAASGPILLGASALVFGFSYLDSKVKDFAFQGSDSYLAHAYETFTEERMTFAPAQRVMDWRLTKDDFDNAARYAGGNYSKLETKYFDRLYKAYDLSTKENRQAGYVSILRRIKADHPDDPGKWVGIFDNYVTTIANYFFDTLNEDTRVMLSRIYNRGHSDWWNTQSEIDAMKKDMVKKLRYELNTNGKFYKNFMEESYTAMKEQVYSAIGKQQDYLNQVLYFDLDLKDSKGNTIPFGKSPEYKGKYIIFDLSGCKEQLKGSAPWSVDMNDESIFQCTLNSYLLAGQPTKLLVYESYRAYRSGKAAIKEIPVPAVDLTVQATSDFDSNIRLEDLSARSGPQSESSGEAGTVLRRLAEIVPLGGSTRSRHNGAVTTIISITNEIPTLEEVAGTYENASLVIAEVKASYALQAALNEIGCDLDELVGTSTELPFTVTRVGEDTAVLATIKSEDQENYLFSDDPMTYDPAKGVLKAMLTVEGQRIELQFNCSYTDAEKLGVYVAGTFEYKDPEVNGLTIVYRLSGSKPLGEGSGGSPGGV